MQMMSLAALVAAREAGKARPEHMVALARDAVARRDGEIRAFCHVADDPAIAAEGPLAGIAIGVKDIFDTFDMPTTYGSDIYADYRPMTDAAVVALARRRGGTIMGKTVTTELAYFHPGPTVNPRNAAHTPGGSSSGSAAAVAAGMVPAAIGSQTGGSVIRPASFCGVAGYKPSFRLLPTTGMKHFSPSLDTVGLFAAGVADVALFASLLTGRPLEPEAVAPEETRVGVYFCSELESADPEMSQALERAAEAAVAAGFEVIAISEPEENAAARAAHSTLQNFEAGMSCGPDLALFKDRLSEKLRATLVEGLAITPEAYDAARRAAKRGRSATRRLFDGIDVLLTPSASGPAPEGLSFTGDPRFNKLWTLMGTPAVNIPGFTAQSGLPLGIQAVGRFGHDRKLLSVAAALEEAFRTA
jgi:Asp-tRNA(Asn)/Glu-tRNA(Gln) amidotransferase A subunit family amidase